MLGCVRGPRTTTQHMLRGILLTPDVVFLSVVEKLEFLTVTAKGVGHGLVATVR